MEAIKINSLLLYKNRPARLLAAGDRFEIEVEGGEKARVRLKDVVVLHPGPLASLRDLNSLPSDMSGGLLEAWELLAGEFTSLSELSELAYGAFTPAAAWAVWQQVQAGLYFEGTPEKIYARPAEEVQRRKQEREQAEAARRGWQDFLQRLRDGQFIEADREQLQEVVSLAEGRSERSQIMRELGRSETPDQAHALLLELGLWDAAVNPYPIRLSAQLRQADLPVPQLPEEARRDLTHLPAYAIDDEGTDTPDDAISFEPGGAGGRLWVHVADVAALVPPDSPLDLEARSRGMSLHLPEGTVHLLPRDVTLALGMGLAERSPALSFGIDLNENGQVSGFEVTPSWVRAGCLSYAAAEQQIEAPPFDTLERLTIALRERRRAAGAVMIDFPELKFEVDQGVVQFHPLPALRSRALVEEAMILTGIETARFAAEKGLLLPFSQQEPLDTPERPSTLSGMFALRRLMKRSRFRTEPGPHGGLGAAAYSQVTSPLRRYLDLVAHQQLRAYLLGQPLLDEAALSERIAAVEPANATIRQVEVLSEKHWTIAYLLQQPEWRGAGILVDKRGSSGIVMIPDLAWEARVYLPRDIPLDTSITMALTGVNLPQREASFRVLK